MDMGEEDWEPMERVGKRPIDIRPLLGLRPKNVIKSGDVHDDRFSTSKEDLKERDFYNMLSALDDVRKTLPGVLDSTDPELSYGLRISSGVKLSSKLKDFLGVTGQEKLNQEFRRDEATKKDVRDPYLTITLSIDPDDNTISIANEVITGRRVLLVPNEDQKIFDMLFQSKNGGNDWENNGDSRNGLEVARTIIYESAGKFATSIRRSRTGAA